MSTQLTTRPDLSQEPKTLAALLKHPAYASRFNELLKDQAPQFISSIVQVGRALGDDCDPKSIIASAMIAAAIDMPINQSLGFAWIVPYRVRGKKMAQFQMGYKGYVQLALRTGQYSRLNVCPVYKGELIGADKLTGDIHIDSTKRTGDEVIGYASYMKLVSGFEHAEYWSVQTVKEHAQRYSQSFRSGGDSPWKTNFDQMAMKTVLSSHIRHWGPMSVSVNKAVESDGAVFSAPDAAPEWVDNKTAAENDKPSLAPAIDDGEEGDIDKTPPAHTAPAESVEPEKDPVVEKITHRVEHPAKLVDISEPVPIAPDSPQAGLIDVLTSAGVDLNMFATYINVNKVDASLSFNAEMTGHVSRWPDAACKAIASNAQMMSRIVQKYGAKKTT